MPPPLSAQEFVAKWRQAKLKERSAAQEHFIDVCRLIGHATPAEADPRGASFVFEAGADKLRGGHGWADVWKKGYFAWEYKGKHADLDRAYQQLLQYRESLLNPPLLIVSDIDTVVIHTNFTNTVKRVTAITLDDLLTPDGLKRLRAAFENPDFFKAAQTTEQVTQAAAAEFARLADLLRKYGEQPQQAAHFLIRILFCLFAEDVGLLSNDLFTRLVAQARRKSGAFTAQLKQLFAAMATGGWFGSDQIVHFDGGLFDDDAALTLDSDGLDVLARVTSLDWSSIEPSIFGTLFERSLDLSKRAQLGAHYTSREDILLIVEPVLMQPLRRRWAEIQTQARDLAAQRGAVKDKKQRARLDDKLRRLLLGFATDLAKIQVLDPACGSGNFLYVALLLLLDLWKEVSTLMSRLGFKHLLPAFDPAPSPLQLHGIETNEYARELAQATIWIGYIQWLHQNGFGFPAEPILKPIETILRMDAILAYAEQGRPVEPEWPQADVIIGNPPFLGDKKMRMELGSKYVNDLRALYANRLSGQIDLVCYWFEKARTMIESMKAKRAGLLATNSIRNGANNYALQRIKQTGDIFWAISDRDWVLDGAAVNVSMVGFDDGEEQLRYLDSLAVTRINSDLSSTANVAQVKPLRENAGICFLGMMKAGPFDIDFSTAQQMLSAPLNPNSRPNSDVVKPRIGGQEVTGRRRDIWVIDFGVNTTEQEAALYEIPFEYVRKHVKPIRDKNRRERLKIKWWLFGESRSGLRKAMSNLRRCIITPEVAKHRIFVWMDTHIIPDHTLHVIARDDDYFLGVLHSRSHEVWSLRTGSTLEDRPRYSSSRTFETFPFPWPPGKEPKKDPRVKAIAQAARELVQQRDAWLNPPGASEAELKKRTLTNLYNQRLTWLDLAHRKLDEAVFDAYGWPPSGDLGDEEMLSRLLALNLERAAKQA